MTSLSVFSIFLFLLVACTNATNTSDNQSTPKGDRGYDHGNGGDGIVLEDGSVQLFDLWERKVTSLPEASPDYETSALARAIPKTTFFSDERTVDQVQRFLYTAGRFAPAAFVRAFVQELSLVQWNMAAKDLAPNPDTKPWLELTGVKRIGCARHLNSQILVSPSCYSNKMEPQQKAALVFHEIIYRLYKKKHPDAQSSFDVRTVTATLFSRETITSINSVLSNSGFRHILEAGEPEETLFGTINGKDTEKWFQCSSVNQNAFVTQLVLHIEYPYLVLGKFQLSGDKHKVLTFKNIGNDLFKYSDYEASLPVFDIPTYSTQFEISSNHAMNLTPTIVKFSYYELTAEVKTPGIFPKVDYAAFNCETLTHKNWAVNDPSTWPALENIR